MDRRCIVFDLDDTLFLERDYVRSGLAAVARIARSRCGVDGFEQLAWDAFERGTRGRLFDEVLSAQGVPRDAELIAALVAEYRSHTPAIALLPDAAAAIRSLRERGARIAVISDGPLESQRAKATAVGAEHWADVVVFTAELGEGRGKPHPMAYELVQERCSFEAGQCVYVGDNPMKDFVAPHQLGWATARVRRPGSLHEAVDSGSDVDREDVDLRWIT